MTGETAAHCSVCGARVRAESITYTQEVGGQVFIVKEVPAVVCPQCGEQYLAPIPWTPSKSLSSMAAWTRGSRSHMCRSINSRTLPQADERGHRKREIRPHQDAGIDLSAFGDSRRRHRTPVAAAQRHASPGRRGLPAGEGHIVGERLRRSHKHAMISAVQELLGMAT